MSERKEHGLLFYAAIIALQKGGLVDEIKSPSHKQMKVQKLSKLGIEIAHIISDIKQINRSHDKLKKVLVDRFGIAENLDEDGIKYELISKGWSLKEISFYREFTRYAILLITESLNMVYNVLIYNYSALFLKYDIKNIARLILNSIILEALVYHIAFTKETTTMKQLYYLKDNNEGTRIIMDRLLSSIDAIETHNPHLDRLTIAEGEDLLSSICSMLVVPKNIIEDCVSDINKTLKVFETELTQGGPETHFTNGVMVKNSHEETRTLCRRKLFILGKMLNKSS